MDAQNNHKAYDTMVEVVTAAVHAGVDSNCGSYFERGLPAALNETFNNSTLTSDDLQGSISRLLTQRFKLGLFEPQHPDVPRASLNAVDSPVHRALAKKTADQGIVLLQNHKRKGKPLLPLKAKGTHVALVGPNSNATKNLLGDYISDPVSWAKANGVTPPWEAVSVLAAILGSGFESVTHERGCLVTLCRSNDVLAKGIRSAAS